MAAKQKHIASLEQVENTISIIKNVKDKPPLLTRDDVLHKLSDAIIKLHNGRHSVQEIVDLINSSQGETNYIFIKPNEVKKIISKMAPVIEERRRSRKEYIRKRKLAEERQAETHEETYEETHSDDNDNIENIENNEGYNI